MIAVCRLDSCSYLILKSKVKVQCISTFLCTLQLALELVQTIHTLGEDWGNHSFVHSFIGQTRACPMVVKFENIVTKMWSPEDFIMQLRGGIILVLSKTVWMAIMKYHLGGSQTEALFLSGVEAGESWITV